MRFTLVAGAVLLARLAGADATVPGSERAGSALISVLVVPAGATVFLDGAAIGLAPVRHFRTRVGTHHLQLTWPRELVPDADPIWDRTVQVPAGGLTFYVKAD